MVRKGVFGLLASLESGLGGLGGGEEHSPAEEEEKAADGGDGAKPLGTAEGEGVKRATEEDNPEEPAESRPFGPGTGGVGLPGRKGQKGGGVDQLVMGGRFPRFHVAGGGQGFLKSMRAKSSGGNTGESKKGAENHKAGS